ncbi:MIZ zinc finger family protein [Tritrichomonas foetus]|uniref:MIZ zinc finger family protein n=1 Tax=Tritrichomonas foetus TaxID=1144522 RepID=A0A1J4JZQ4_9EUKA|nr:MIZ zinc finger family protein [Tritrichomonas foetus]|eukprot:OHT04647.1 MIZ zinc finger family protein [Tritrichomonas foetus]
MSSPIQTVNNPIRGPRGGAHPRPKPILRNVRLDLPSNANKNDNMRMNLNFGMFNMMNTINISTIHGRSLPTNSMNLMTSQSLSPRYNDEKTSEIQLFSPSIFIEFVNEPNPVFIFNVLIPSSAQSFMALNPIHLNNPCLLCYFLATDMTSQFPVHVLINQMHIRHICGDGIPINITNILNPFGHENWIVVDSSSFTHPFFVIGVWGQQKTMNQILKEIASSNYFVAPPNLDICPISKSIVEIPARGIHCTHRENFDASSFIAVSQAIGLWQCPICHQNLPMNELLVDLSRFHIQEYDPSTFDGTETLSDGFQANFGDDFFDM